MTILVVDDQRSLRLTLRAALEAGGHEVVEAQNGHEAMEILRSRAGVGCAIVDWEMPGMSGTQLCREIRSSTLGDTMYLILLTGRNAVQDKVEGLSAGADDFVSKPFEPAELLARVQGAERRAAMQTHTVVIFALARLAESRDPETGAHLERVQHYARELAAQLAGQGHYADQVDAEFIRLVFETSPLHDIGKVAIPDSVLLKPGRLSEPEYQVMKQHTLIGAQTLGAALERFPRARFLHIARDIALAHHERWDGGGYPSGLAGDLIPLAARVVAIADVYDALTSRRVYKAALMHDVACSIILEGSGSHFDPLCVEAFKLASPEFDRIRERFRDEHTQPLATIADARVAA